MTTEAYVRELFKGLEQGDGASFFEHVDDKVDWIVEGTHPLAGHYKSKADFLAGTFAKLAKVLPHGAQLFVEHLFVKNDEAVVELRQALQVNPNYPEAHYNFGCLLASLGRKEEATAQFAEALRLQPDYSDAKEQLQRLALPTPDRENP